MNQVKTDAIRVIESLPDDCTTDDIHYHLYFREKALRGIKAIDEGDHVPHDQVRSLVKQWRRATRRCRRKKTR